ncbi:MAG TPA: trypsin-like peptidase domain-containing protein [Nocardioidaceae bacterium]|nr:trypsin-like peptidase domain-containing protein [Nocardioidaceae bacterium]
MNQPTPNTDQFPARDEETATLPAADTDSHTHRYGPFNGSGPMGFAGGPPLQERPRSSRPSGVFTAGILTAAVVVGGMSGLVGAAGFAAADSLTEGTSTTSTPTATDAPVVSTDSAPEPGSVEDVANSVLPSVVKINVQGEQGQGSGSGIILSADGEILTNNHVVEVAAAGGSVSVSFEDGSSAEAEILGTDPLTDLAVIKAQDVSGLSPATLSTSDTIDVGEEVVAIGSPFGLEATVTSGIVSALNRPVSVGQASPDAMDTTYPAIQTDAAINPGNSGGPLVNMLGEVVGVNSSIRTTSSATSEGAGSIGLGFAIPLSKVLAIVDQLRSGETPTHARLGVTVSDATDSDGLLTGAGIGSVNDGSSADEAGLQSGDVVTKIDDELVTSSESLVATIRGYRPGDSVTLTVVRGGDDTATLDVTLDSDEGSPTS